MGALVILIGAALIAASVFFYVRARGKAQASQTWPTVQGTVTASEVLHKTETDSDGEREDVYYAQPAYSYVVDGQSFAAKRVSFGGQTRFTDRAKAEAIVARYPAGAAVTVMYNPKAPAEAVLESAKPPLTGAIVLSVTGLILAFVGVALI